MNFNLKMSQILAYLDVFLGITKLIIHPFTITARQKCTFARQIYLVWINIHTQTLPAPVKNFSGSEHDDYPLVKISPNYMYMYISKYQFTLAKEKYDNYQVQYIMYQLTAQHIMKIRKHWPVVHTSLSICRCKLS